MTLLSSLRQRSGRRRLVTARCHQGNILGAEGALFRSVGRRHGAMAAEERYPEIRRLPGTINQDADADYPTAPSGNRRHDLPDGAAGGQDIVDDEDPLPGTDIEAATEDSFLAFFLCVEAAYSHLAANFMRQDNAAGGRPGHNLDITVSVMFRDHPAELLGQLRKLHHLELFPVHRRVQSRGQPEVPLEQGS